MIGGDFHITLFNNNLAIECYVARAKPPAYPRYDLTTPRITTVVV